MQKGDTERALDALEALIVSPGFQAPMLAAIALDALNSAALPVARTIVTKMYELTLPCGDKPPAVELHKFKVCRSADLAPISAD